jgi:twitching motility protein PilT
MKPRIDQLLRFGREQGCSDIHLAVGQPPLLRILGEISETRLHTISAVELSEMLNEVMDDAQRRSFEAGHDLDFSYSPGSGERYRFNLYRKMGGVGCAIRVVPRHIRSLDQLGLPPIVKKLATAHQGMLLVTGATGTGKSTTLAAIIDHLNSTRKLNIITLEDPVEFLHESKMSLVVQREIGTSVRRFEDGLRAALREDPDVILVGELRDAATVMMAMTAAETGHLVLASLHTTSAAKTLDRIIDVLPAEQKAQGITCLAQTLRGVVSQTLVMKPDRSGRKLIVEIMVMTPAISNLLTTDRAFQVSSVIQTSREVGMQLLDQALVEAVLAKEIDADQAYLHAQDKKLLQRFVTNTKLLPPVKVVGR